MLFSFEQRVNGTNDNVIGRIEFDSFPEWRTYEVKLPNLDLFQSRKSIAAGTSVTVALIVLWISGALLVGIY